LHHRIRLMARHPFAVPVLTILGLMILTGVVLGIVNVLSADKQINPNVVVISHDGKSETVSSKEPTVGALLQKLHLKLNDGDIVEPAQNTRIQQDDFRINLYRAVPVAIFDSGHRTYTFSAATTPRSVARQAGLSLYPEDNVIKQPVTDFVANGNIGEELIIERSTQVNMNLYGAPLTTRTRASTVKALLAEKNIKLLPQDVVSPSRDTPITPGVQVSVVRNGIATRTFMEDIPTPVQVIIDNTLSYGVSAIRQQGAPGKRAVTYEINTQNGVEVSRRAIQATVIQEPVTQITVQGANLSGIKGDMALAGIAPSDYQYADYIISHESGWCPTKAQGQYGGCPPYAGSVPATGGYGLCQSTPGSKMSTAGADWATNPVTQLKWCSGYARSRYGSWGAAYNHWVAYHNW
jgi:uncharacterized protein YabE (DUF348 family)